MSELKQHTTKVQRIAADVSAHFNYSIHSNVVLLIYIGSIGLDIGLMQVD